MFNKLFIFALALMIGLGQLMAQPTAKMTKISRVHELTGELLRIAQQHVAHGGESAKASLNAQIDSLLQGERDPDVLARVALISNVYLQPGSAGDQSFDEAFEVGWGACIRRIEQIGGRPAIDALEYIHQNMRLDGAFSLIWKGSMERLRARQKGEARF